MKFIGIILLVVLILAVIGLGPLITIWSLNTVFSLTIATNFWTWLGTLWLGTFFTFAGSGIKSKGVK